jgi:hypothetical protein
MHFAIVLRFWTTGALACLQEFKWPKDRESEPDDGEDDGE